MERGEIYFIQRRDTVGSEIAKARPAVVVSDHGQMSPIVSVVYLTTQPKRDLPSHAKIYATGIESTALCEQIDTISVALVGDYCGECTAEEMKRIDEALAVALGLKKAGPIEHQIDSDLLALITLERDFYRAYTERLKRMKGLE
jgi:mRNA interferase MazF